MARIAGLPLLLLVGSCAGMGAAMQDAGMPGLGAAGGAAVGLATGVSGLFITGLAALGAMIMSLLDQSAEGQIALADVAPLGLWPILDLLFWPVLIVVAICWVTPTPLAFVKAILRGLKWVAGLVRPRQQP